MQSSKLQLKIQKLINPLLIIGFAVILRLLPHVPNVAPIAAMALFGGAYLNKRYALVVPLIALIISDIFLGFHDTMPYVYGSFLLAGLIGIWLKSHKTVWNIFFAAVASSIVFFLITNFGVWLQSGMYTRDLAGLIQCYIYALPFFRNTLFGDLLYVGLFFGSYELVLPFYGSKNLYKNRG